MRAAQDDQMDRADLCWDIDQEAAIEALAARLPGNPARVSRQLRQSAHGCRWLLARLEALKAPLVEDGVWDEAQCDRVAQLLGIGPDTRDAHPYFRPGADLAGLIELVSDQVAVLQGPLVEALDPLDAKERELTSLGIPLRPSKELLRLQRNETKLRRILNESLAEFRRLRAEGYAGPELITGLVEPATVAEPPRPPSSPHAAIPDPPSEEPELTREEAVAPLTDRPVMSKSATMLDTVQSNLAGQAAPEKARSTPPSKPTDRKARRKREQAARKRARSH